MKMQKSSSKLLAASPGFKLNDVIDCRKLTIYQTDHASYSIE